jgi:hypothetical protein
MARRRSVRIVIAVVLLAVVAAVVGTVVLTSGSSSSDSTTPTAAQLYAQEARFGTFNAFVPGSDPDELDRGGSNVDDIVKFLGHGRYQLTVQNVGFLGYINSFSWNAPNILITRVVGSSSGSCQAAKEHTATTQFGALPEGTITCGGMAIAPPTCSCLAGGTATVTFEGHPIASRKGVVFGVAESRLVLGNLTLVPHHIPSYLGGAANQVDEPLCAKGEQSTKANPCVHTS